MIFLNRKSSRALGSTDHTTAWQRFFRKQPKKVMVFGKWFCWNRISGLNLNLMPKWASFCSWAIDCRDWPTSYFWPARQPWKSEWRFETRDNSTHFSKLFLIMVVSISKSPSAHNNLMFFLKRSADLQRLLGIAFKSQKIKLEDKTAENWWRPGAQKDRSTPVVGQSCSVPPRTRLLVQPWVIQVWLIWIRLRCSRYSRYSRRYGRNGSTYRSKYTINLFKNTTFISKRCVFQRWFLSIRSWLSKPQAIMRWIFKLMFDWEDLRDGATWAKKWAGIG